MSAQSSGPGTPSRSGVLERATRIVDCLSEAPGRLLLDDIAEISGIPRSTASRMLRQLEGFGWVDHGAGGYGIGPRLRHHGASSDLEDLRSVAGPVLNRLAASTGSVAHLGVMHAGYVHYLDKIGGGAAASIPSQIGTRIIASEAVCGLAILAQLEWDDVRAILDQTGVERVVAEAPLHRQLAAVRRRGLAYSDGGRRASGISSIGAAIVGPAGPVAAVSVARRGALSLTAVGPQVTSAAESISHALFGEWGTQSRGSAR